MPTGNDDIVTRLREWHTAWDWDLPDQAADEIERLRAERDSWRNLAKLARKSWHTDSWLDFDKAYIEAVRGE